MVKIREVLSEIADWTKSNWKKLFVIGLALTAALLESYFPGNPGTKPLVDAVKAVITLLAL